MNFVIPMAGRGQRFINAGYIVPKMLIEAHGKTLLEWSIDSLPLELCTNLVCIILAEHEREHQLSQKISAIYASRCPVRFFFLDQVTRGQAETVLLAKDLFIPGKELLIYNIDTYFHSDTLASVLLEKNHDGILGAFPSRENRFSYAMTDEHGFVIKTAEKVVISDHALTGLYHFKCIDDFIETATYHIDNNIRVNNEFYVAPMYNYLIDKGRKFRVDEVQQHFILGTPEELEIFIKKYDAN